MKTISIGAAIIVILLCTGCAITDVDQTADLSAYHSFGWGKSKLEIANSAYRDDLIESRIQASVKSEFAKRGISYNAKKADLLVSYEGFIERKEQGSPGRIYFYPYYYPYYRGIFYPYGGYMAGAWVEPPTYTTYNEGTLILNIRDRRTGKQIWRGVVSGNVDNLKSLNRKITKGVKAILKKYPNVPPTPPPLPKLKEVVS